MLLRYLSAAALVVLVAAGCGGSARPDRPAARGVPRALATAWEAKASKVADAAAAGDDCLALQLATSLRDEVVADETKLPPRLYSPLLTGVNSIVDRIVCVPPATNPPKEPPKKPPPKPHDDHHHHDHGHGDNGQGAEG
jgi:hypothetical protein